MDETSIETALGEDGAPWSRFEHLTRAELDRIQLERLQAQLRRVAHQSPFFARRFRAAGFDPEIDSLERFRAEAPFTTKQDLVADQEEHPPFGTRLTVDPAEVARFETTSGTSGLGQEVYGLTLNDIRTIASMGAWTLRAQGVGRDDRAAVMLPLGYLQGPWGGHWAATAVGASVLHLGLAPTTEARLGYMGRFGITVLYTPTPTYLMRLANVARATGFEPRRDLPGFKTAWVAGEPYPVEWALRMQEFWGGRLCESYGSTQGAFAATCEHGVVRDDGSRGTLHAMDWHTLMEVIDPETGEPTAPGETGEVVLTTLTREASPVIRFRTGDRARFVPPGECPCGRQGFAIEAGTIGRLDDMIKVKGMNVWPAAVDSIVLSTPGVHDYVGEVGLDTSGHEYARVRVAFADGVGAADRSRALEGIARSLRAATNVTMEVVEVDTAELPEFEYKARRWTDHRAEDLLSNASAVSSD